MNCEICKVTVEYTDPSNQCLKCWCESNNMSYDDNDMHWRMNCEICKRTIDSDDEYAVSNDECYICNNCYMENEK